MYVGRAGGCVTLGRFRAHHDSRDVRVYLQGCLRSFEHVGLSVRAHSSRLKPCLNLLQRVGSRLAGVRPSLEKGPRTIETSCLSLHRPQGGWGPLQFSRVLSRPFESHEGRLITLVEKIISVWTYSFSFYYLRVNGF